jgi:GNAT superfamily N-acetyltransferase
MGKQQRYNVREVTTKEELEEIMDVIWAANYTPYDPFVQLFFPVQGYTSAHRESAIAESKDRFWNQHQADPSSHWYYALDTATGKIVGCAQWVISRTNPFAEGVPKLKAPWWPEGESRRFCESIMNQVYRPRASWMTRPHCGKWSQDVPRLYFLKHVLQPQIGRHSRALHMNCLSTPLTPPALNWMAVHPSHRHLGIGSLLMTVGISQADALNLECWMEASAMGKPLYEKFQFQSLLKIAFDNERPGASDEWRKCAHEITPPPVFAMWRPKRGLMSKHEDRRWPWDLGTV